MGTPTGGLIKGVAAGPLYLLRDEFRIDRAAGSVNGTAPEPGPGPGSNRFCEDTGSQLSISGGKVVISGASASNNPKLLYGAIVRAAGLMMSCKYNPTNNSTGAYIGWSANSNPSVSHVQSLALRVDENSSGYLAIYDGAVLTYLDRFTKELEHTFGFILKAAGCFLLALGGSFTSDAYTLLYWYDGGTSSPVYPMPYVSAGTAVGATGTIDSEIVRQLAGGFAQTGGPYTFNSASPAANETHTATIDGAMRFTWTPGAGEVLELSWRYQDTDNRWYVECDQTNSTLKIFYVIGGVATQLSTTAAKTWTVATPYIITVQWYGRALRVLVNNSVAKVLLTTALYNNGYTTVKTNLAGTNWIGYPRHLTLGGNPVTITNPDRAWATNAAAYLTTPTADASGQVVHPDVLYIPGGWNGYEYWMAITGFYHGNSDYENPHILASADGETWVVPPGGSNPIDPKPASTYNSDPDLIIDQNNIMWCVYREAGAANDIINARYSSDGINWSDEITILTGDVSGIISPAIIWDGSQYVMYSIIGATNVIERRTASSISGTWSSPTTCSITIPGGKAPWHLDIIFADGIYYALIATTATIQLWFATSKNGEDFTAAASELMSASVAGWDNGQLYRGTIVRTLTGFDCWYSASDNVAPPNTNWFCGFTKIGY